MNLQQATCNHSWVGVIGNMHCSKCGVKWVDSSKKGKQ